MLYDELLKLIDSEPVRAFLDRQKELIEDIDPNRIYVENVRAFFKIPNRAARLLCDLAVREGAFERRIGFLCPHEEHIVASFESDEDIPKKVHCRVCEMDGRESVHDTEEMDRMDFYRLLDRADG